VHVLDARRRCSTCPAQSGQFDNIAYQQTEGTACPCLTQAWTPCLPICISITALTRQRPSGRWCACCAPAATGHHRLGRSHLRMDAQEMADEWLALTARRFAPGSEKPGWSTSWWTHGPVVLRRVTDARRGDDGPFQPPGQDQRLAATGSSRVLGRVKRCRRITASTRRLVGAVAPTLCRIATPVAVRHRNKRPTLYRSDIRRGAGQVPPEAANLSLGCGNPVALASLRPARSCSTSQRRRD